MLKALSLGSGNGGAWTDRLRMKHCRRLGGEVDDISPSRYGVDLLSLNYSFWEWHLRLAIGSNYV